MIQRVFKILLTVSLVFLSITLNATTEPVEREVYAMGTYLRMSLYEPSRTKAVKHLENLLTVVEDAEHQLSTWRVDSEVSRLNSIAFGARFPASRSLFDLMQRVQNLCRLTDGYFDPSVGELTAAWKIHAGFALPPPSAINDALQKSGCGKLQLLDDSTIIKSTALTIDVGGFGKGEALDRALATATMNDFAPLLLNFGGQIAVRGSPPGETGWRVQIANPIQRTSSVLTVQIFSGSLSTSAGSERDGQVNGKRVGHILNPHTGYPVESFGSVTVWRKTALEADVMSTALYAMGPVRGFEWAIQHDVAACFLIAKEDKIQLKMTPGFQKLIVK